MLPSNRSGALPWQRPRHELLLLLLVALAVLTPINVISEQDRSRFCLSEALLHGRISDDPCFASTGDRATFAGHLYTDKAPGVSVLATPAVAAIRPGPPPSWSGDDVRLWGVRVLSVGLSFLVLAFMVGRVAEGISPGFGGVVLVTFALGSLVAPLAATGFGHVPAAAFAFAAFLLAWARRPLLAGLVAGAGVLVEYETGIALAVVACYLAATAGWRPLRSYLLGVLPGAVLLGAYDWAAFGSPLHLSYRYVAPAFAADQKRGFFGIGVPHEVGLYKVFSWHSGLLVLSPALALAGLGLVWLGRGRRPEAIAAGAIAVLYVLANTGYYDAYGGRSPGPRFLVAGLPFLALGLGPALTRLPRLTLLLSAWSVVATTALTLVWSRLLFTWGGIWGALWHVPSQLGASRYARAIMPSVLDRFGPTSHQAVAVAAGCAVAAFLVAALGVPRTAFSPIRRRPSGRVALAVAGCLALIGAANVMAITDYPYGEKLVVLPDLRTQVTAPAPSVYMGGMINLQIAVKNVGTVGATRVHLYVDLPPELRLVGLPRMTRGVGCTGSTTLDCNLDNLSPGGKQVATIYFGLQGTSVGPHELKAFASAPTSIGNTAKLTILVTT